MEHAYHEAGHAVIAALLGGEVRGVTLQSELAGHDGHCAIVWPPVDAAAHARRSALVALGGPVAEQYYRGGMPEDPRELSSWRGDWAEAEACLAQLAPAVEREALRRQLLEELARAFDDVDVWERVARVADAVDAHGELDADLFEAALGDLPCHRTQR